MRITLIGYGKMGRMIEEIGRGMGHEIIHTIDIDDSPGEAEFSGNWVENSAVVIDFSVAEAVGSNIINAVAAGLPIVEGTTGWNGQLETVRQIVEDAKGACVYSSNYSMGVLALFHLTRQAGKLLSRWKAYRPFIHEAHHDQKVDSPSGTALKTIELIRQSLDEQESQKTADKPEETETVSGARGGRYLGIPVHSIRLPGYVAHEEALFGGTGQVLSIRHDSISRSSFMPGVLLGIRKVVALDKLYYGLDEILDL